MPGIKLLTVDNEIVEVDADTAKQSMLLRSMLHDLGVTEIDDDEEAIPLPHVTAAALRKAMAWCAHHKDDPPPPEDDENARDLQPQQLSSWDAEFLRMDQSALFELIQAANYLDIRGLLDTACKAVADAIRGRSPEEIRKAFNIRCDFTPQEEEQVRRETEWCEEK
uniref:Skp1-related protein n=1 Tax=Macrostomum lignano TaxID=282301 RepID=A0A1I8I7U8_9PLAT